MKKVPVTSFEYVFNKEEVSVLKDCLDYCYHRATKHPKSGILRVQNPVTIQKLKDQVAIAVK